MTQLSRWSATRPAAGVAAFGLLAAALVGTPTAAAAVGHGTMVPAIGSDPHYQVAGQVDASPTATTFSCQLTNPAGCYGPAQIRAAYGVDKVAATGAGRTIVIIDAFQAPAIRSDLAVFDRVFGLPDPTLNVIAPDGLTPFDPTDGNMIGWSAEITLDVEWAHAIAPGATIDLVLARSNNDADILSATRYAILNNLGDVISQSFGEAEQCMDRSLVDQQHVLFALAALRGITVLASSGDQGSAEPTCDGTSFFKAASTPASDPFVTAVGGTRLVADGITGAYSSESVWNEPAFGAAGGGGFSTIYRAPFYQHEQHLSARGVPDISYNAAIIGGVLVVWSESGLGPNLVFRFGGTSAGSPQWAGLTVLANELGQHRVGFLNPRLYDIARRGEQGRYLHDITTGDNTFHGAVTVPGFAATPGWDAATGLGTPNAANLLPRLAGQDG